MSNQYAIESALRRLLRLNDSVGGELRGGAYCAEFRVKSNGYPWIQTKTNVVNMAYEKQSEPVKTIRDHGICLPSDTVAVDVQHGKYCTLEFARMNPSDFAALIDDLFTKFYFVKADYELEIEFIDLRR